MVEREHNHQSTAPELQPELAAALAGVEYACVTVATGAGTALLVKAPLHEIESARGPVPILLVHELYACPSAPVIRIALRIYDQPGSPLGLETFINVADPSQRADYAALAGQDELPLIFVDETLQQRLAKRVSHGGRDLAPQVLAAAEVLLDQIPPASFDFEQAKRAVMETTHL
jgi:hypothetical protein